MSESSRTEHDSMGAVEVPAAALWRAQTQRAIGNFEISGRPVPPDLVHALGAVKRAAALANAELGVITLEQAGAIVDASAEVAAGEHDDAFPIDVFQTGSGTSTNMNVNEVIATLAARAGVEVHPNDQVNASQSSNDVFPTAIHLAAAAGVAGELVPALAGLAEAFEAKAAEFAGLVKAGRTHLMDATPLTLGQEFGGYAAICRQGVRRLESVLPRVCELPLGGTAVGTGLNAPAGFAARAIGHLAEATGLPLVEAGNHFEAAGGRDSLVELSGVLRTIAVGLTKVCTDLRWLGSGPSAGLAEIRIPDLQPGSSIMPGKVNPVICEAVQMVCTQVIGNDAAVAVAGASGNFELNVQLPVLAANLLDSIRLLAAGATSLAVKCVAGIEANPERMRTYAESSPAIVTGLNRLIGYEAAAAIVKDALVSGRTIREQVIAAGHLERGELTEPQLDAALDVDALTSPD